MINEQLAVEIPEIHSGGKEFREPFLAKEKFRQISGGNGISGGNSKNNPFKLKKRRGTEVGFKLQVNF